MHLSEDLVQPVVVKRPRARRGRQQSDDAEELVATQKPGRIGVVVHEEQRQVLKILISKMREPILCRSSKSLEDNATKVGLQLDVRIGLLQYALLEHSQQAVARCLRVESGRPRGIKTVAHAHLHTTAGTPRPPWLPPAAAVVRAFLTALGHPAPLFG